MADKVPQRNPGRGPPPPLFAAGVKSLFIEYQPVKDGCCDYNPYVGVLGSFGKTIRGWDHARLVILEGNVTTVEATARGQWWDLGINPGGTQCYYNNSTFAFDQKRLNKYTHFGFTGDQCTGEIITKEAEEWIDIFRKQGFDLIFRNCLAFANNLASSILDEKEKRIRAAVAEAEISFQMSGVYVPINAEYLQ